ncbi:MAG: hypothetical protein ACYTG1_04075 [Planctomycetota bacterium]
MAGRRDRGPGHDGRHRRHRVRRGRGRPGDRPDHLRRRRAREPRLPPDRRNGGDPRAAAARLERRRAGHRRRAFLTTGGGAMQDLGTLGGVWAWAFDVNGHRQVVGEAGPGDQRVRRRGRRGRGRRPPARPRRMERMSRGHSTGGRQPPITPSSSSGPRPG